jgi:hypothetical protein
MRVIIKTLDSALPRVNVMRTRSAFFEDNLTIPTSKAIA